MIVVRFKVTCQEGKTAELAAAMAELVAAARGLPGVIHFDIARDLTDDNALIATEVFQDRATMEREEALPEVVPVVELMQGGALAGPRSGRSSRSPPPSRRRCDHGRAAAGVSFRGRWQMTSRTPERCWWSWSTAWSTIEVAT